MVMYTAFKACAIFVTLSFLVGCGQNVSPSVSIRNDNLDYFGFAAIDCGYDDPTDGISKTNFVDEVSGFTNVGQMCVYSPDEILKERMAKFDLAGVKAILHIEGILFERTENVYTHSGFRVALRVDAATRWAKFVNANRDVLVPHFVAALYVVDEPVWNGVSPADFSHALKIVKTAFPDIPTMSIEASLVIEQVMVPVLLDWIGFDRYDTVDPEADGAWLADLATVHAARSRPDQRIVLVASTQWLPYYLTDGGIRPEDMGRVVFSYYRVAASNPDVIALIGYLWPGGLDDPAQLGARNLPVNVLNSLREIGEEITGK